MSSTRSHRLQSCSVNHSIHSRIISLNPTQNKGKWIRQLRERATKRIKFPRSITKCNNKWLPSCRLSWKCWRRKMLKNVRYSKGDRVLMALKNQMTLTWILAWLRIHHSDTIITSRRCLGSLTIRTWIDSHSCQVRKTINKVWQIKLLTHPLKQTIKLFSSNSSRTVALW